MPTMRAISRMDFPLADNSCMVLMVPLLIIATSLVSKINTRVALLKGWVNSFLAFMGQLYLGLYKWIGKGHTGGVLDQVVAIRGELPGNLWADGSGVPSNQTVSHRHLAGFIMVAIFYGKT